VTATRDRSQPDRQIASTEFLKKERFGKACQKEDFSSCRAITSRWISLVPSPIVEILASR